MKQFISVLLAVLPLFVSAQTPDDDKVEAEIHNSASPYYYPNLMARYRQGDPALTAQDYRHLYYGYMFQGDYNPYTSPQEADSIVMILLREPELNLEDYRNLILYGSKVMEIDPFNPRILNIMTYAYAMVGDTENETRSAARFNGIIDAILSSGEGNVEKSPWHILYFPHAEDVLDFLGQKYRKPMVVSRTTEYFPLEKRDGRTRGYYFDYSRVYTRHPDNPSQPQQRRWQINDRVVN